METESIPVQLKSVPLHGTFEYSKQCNTDIGTLTEKSTPIIPHIFHKVAFLFVHFITPEQEQKIVDLVVKCFGHRCNACIKRAQFFCTLSGKDRSRFDPALTCPQGSFIQDLVKGLSELADTITKTEPVGLYFVPHGQTFVGYLYPHCGTLGDHKFLHFALALPADSTCMKSVNIAMIQKGLYTLLFESTIFVDLIARMKRQGLTSLELFTQVCDKSTYGERVFGHAIRWMIEILKTSDSDLATLIDHILRAGLSYVTYTNIDCTLRHTADQILTILEDPETKSFEGLSKLLAQRADPHAYRRTTAPPTQGQLKVALDAFADFCAQVMPLEFGKTLPGFTSLETPIAAPPITTAAGSIIQDMIERTQHLKVSGSVSFADRMKGKVDPLCLRDEIRSLSTIDAFLAFMKKHPSAKVSYLNGETRQMCYFATCTFGKNKDGKDKVGLADYLPGYIWGYNGCNLGYAPWDDCKVIGVMHTKTSLHNNYVFILGPTKPKFTLFSGCFFPEFLHSSIAQTCGSTFEALKDKHSQVMTIPDGHLMAGYGTSVSDKATKLLIPTTLSISVDNVTEHCTLTHESVVV
jgi:hypothetical protein